MYTDNLSSTLQLRHVMSVNCKSLFFNITRYGRGSQFPYVFEKDDPKLPRKRKVSNHFEEKEASVEFVSNVEEYYDHFFYQAIEIIVNCIRNRSQQKDLVETLQKIPLNSTCR